MNILLSFYHIFSHTNTQVSVHKYLSFRQNITGFECTWNQRRFLIKNENILTFVLINVSMYPYFGFRQTYLYKKPFLLSFQLIKLFQWLWCPMKYTPILILKLFHNALTSVASIWFSLFMYTAYSYYIYSYSSANFVFKKSCTTTIVFDKLY